MKKLISLPLLLLLLFTLPAFSQEIGFRTTDIGAEFQWYPDGKIYNLHLAFNAKLNHSFQFRFGYNHINTHRYTDHVEEGNGWGGGVGYRYYFKPFPYQFFVGVRTDIWNNKISWANSVLEANLKRWMLYPAAETGYTFVINDQCYITIFGALGSQIATGKQTGQSVKYGNSFTSQAGISVGARL